MATPAQLLRRLVLAQSGDAGSWAAERLDALSAGAPERDLHVFLGLAPRRLGKADLVLTPADRAEADAALPGWSLDGWSLDGAARVLGLIVHTAQRPFAERFKDLRRTADVAELVALYRGLPLYPDPAALHFEVGEGLRSSIQPVFEAIAHCNPYPRDHFDEHRWNHMILKALFVGAALAPVVGLKARTNPELARILLDYAEERWAAGRAVTNDLWIPVMPFAAEPAISARLDAVRAAGRLPQEEPA